MISEAAKTVAKETDAQIHLTFLDAYVPTFWNESELGGPGEDPNLVYWADHYFTRDITLGPTQMKLTHAHNVDLTKVDPGVNSHKFPWHWYHATVAGKYVTARRYEGKDLFVRSAQLQYGFARSLEAGAENWRASRLLPMGNEPVQIRPVQLGDDP